MSMESCDMESLCANCIRLKTCAASSWVYPNMSVIECADLVEVPVVDTEGIQNAWSRVVASFTEIAERISQIFLDLGDFFEQLFQQEQKYDKNKLEKLQHSIAMKRTYQALIDRWKPPDSTSKRKLLTFPLCPMYNKRKRINIF